LGEVVANAVICVPACFKSHFVGPGHVYNLYYVIAANAIGIDFGTSYSCVGIFHHGKVEIIPGNATTPTVVAFIEKGRLVGDLAKLQVDVNPAKAICGIERPRVQNSWREKYDSFVQSNLKYWTTETIIEDGKPVVQVEHQGKVMRLSVVEIVSMVLAKMKEVAEAYLGLRKIVAIIISSNKATWAYM